MNQSEARVIRLEDDCAIVEVQEAPSACGNCGKNGQCGSAIPELRHYSVCNTVSARPGDRVIVSVPEGIVLKAAVLSYLMPLLFLFAGAGLAAASFGDGLPAVAGAALGLAAGLFVLRLIDGRILCGKEPRLALKLQRPIPIDKEVKHV
ncbi:MAG: SoxR reducing system RseC family protein [Rhodocyclales bacterium]|nr:SoxR reducing system RseC family protein [Rhodocyclales bacterium]